MMYSVFFGNEDLGKIGLSENKKIIVEAKDANKDRIKNFIKHMLSQDESPEQFLKTAPLRFNGYIKVKKICKN